MADQEFLASFGVEIDESGVSRLQAVLEENRALADSLAASFSAASEAIRALAGATEPARRICPCPQAAGSANRPGSRWPRTGTRNTSSP